METIYAGGISCIQFTQYWFSDFEEYFSLVNRLSSPMFSMDVLFPLVAAVDSVFASQLLLCTAFGGWLNAVMKWWFLDERPYWWVKETSYYSGHARPKLQQTSQTCETGPGCPSGHSTTMGMLVVLALMWAAHVMNDRKCFVWWWRWVAYPVSAAAVASVILSRMFVAAHFPHQCLLGTFIGLFVSAALCIYVTDPYIWSVGNSYDDAQRWHVAFALGTIVITYVTYWGLKVCGVDPYFTLDLAYQFCDNPENIHITSTPLYALVNSTGSLLGAALAISPRAASYRHYTKERSLIIAGLSSYMFTYALKSLKRGLQRDNEYLFYAVIFILAILKPALYIRAVPSLATWPFVQNVKLKVK